MRKLIASMNMTLDGYCDHTAGIADEELHQHYTDLLNASGALVYGRITYQLMENYWPALVKNPSGDKSMDDFALAIDKIPKLVFSRTLKQVDWKTARVVQGGLKEEILALKGQPGKDIGVGSPSLIVASMNLGLVDELQLCVHPVILGGGQALFKDIKESVSLKLLRTKTFGSGVVLFCYEPGKK